MPERRPSIELDPIDLDNDGADASNNIASSGIDDDAIIDSLSPANGKLKYSHSPRITQNLTQLYARDTPNFLFDISC